MCEGVRVTEAQIDVRLGGEVEDGINVMASQAVHDLGWIRDIAMVEGEVALVIERPSIVQRGAVVELVEGDDVVRIWVGQGKMSYKPACTVNISNSSCTAGFAMAYMKPAPPVIIIFLTSGRGSNLVLPVKIGASFQTP